MKKILSYKNIPKVWLGHLLNFFLVLFSVILAFLLNNKDIENNLEEKKRNYIAILKTSLETDKAELRKLILINENKRNELELLRNTLIEKDSVALNGFLAIGSYHFFGVEKSAFELMKNSDVVQVVENNNLLLSVSAVYYTYDEDIEAIQEEYTLSFQRVIEPFLIDNINMVDNSINLNTEKRLNAMNRIYVMEDVLTNVINGYEIAINKIDSALKEINVEIKQ